MVELETETERTDGVTFVRAVVTNTHGTPQFVRLRSRLDGPTWTPQRGEVPAAAWDGDHWERAIQVGQSVGLGFASPAEPVETPLAVVSVERAPADSPRTPEQVLASLDDALPPRTVVGEQR